MNCSVLTPNDAICTIYVYMEMSAFNEDTSMLALMCYFDMFTVAAALGVYYSSGGGTRY